jgi:3-deoxy-D-manno-octulosonic-acid transferase
VNYMLMTTILMSLYSAVMWAIQPFLRQKIARRGKAEPGYLVHIEERFGTYSNVVNNSTNSDQHFVWIHAVSLGETRAAAVLVDALRGCMPSMKLLLTNGTATGRAEGQKLLRDGDVQVWQAWDTVAATERFLQQFKPQIGIMMETELWPNMAATCAKFEVPLVIANARMSEKTYLKTLRFAWLARPAYRSLAAVWPQSADDAGRFEQLGATVKSVFGNVKFDAKIDAQQQERGRHFKTAIHRKIAVFASSREGEELQLLQYLKQNANCMSKLQWLIVPRHPQRFNEVESLIKQYDFNVSKRSDWQEDSSLTIDHKTIWLGNSLGDMAMYYSMSDVALLGGSFEAFGGQNLIEAAACGCPVVMGPSTFNFAQAAEQALAAGAAFQCPTLSHAVNEVIRLTDDAAANKAVQTAALIFASAHQGAANKTATAIQQLLRQ